MAVHHVLGISLEAMASAEVQPAGDDDPWGFEDDEAESESWAGLLRDQCLVECAHTFVECVHTFVDIFHVNFFENVFNEFFHFNQLLIFFMLVITTIHVMIVPKITNTS